MTDETTATPEAKESSKARRFLIPALVVIVAVLLVAFLASRSGLDKALLRQRVDAFAASLAEKGKLEGRDIALTYRDIAITGSFSDRHAVILEPELSIKPLADDGRSSNPADNLILRTAEVAIHPRSVDLSAIAITLAKPVEFFDGADETRKLLTVTANEPFRADVVQRKEDGRPYLAVTHRMPTDIALNYLREQQAEGAEEQTPTLVPIYETLNVTQAAGGLIRSDLAQDGSGLGEAEVKLADISLIPELQPEGAVRIAQVESSWKHTLDEKNHHLVEAKLHIGDITADPELLPYAPMAVTLDATYEGAAPQTAQDLASIREQESSIKLNKFAITSKDSSLTATADFVATATDVLPVGMATVSLTNVPFVLAELRRYQLLDKKNEPLVGDIAALLTGTKLDELTDANIDINRTRGGSFTIGKTTFEEIFATVIKNSMQRAVEKPADADEKKEPARKKLEVEEGTRG